MGSPARITLLEWPLEVPLEVGQFKQTGHDVFKDSRTIKEPMSSGPEPLKAQSQQDSNLQSFDLNSKVLGMLHYLCFWVQVGTNLLNPQE